MPANKTYVIGLTGGIGCGKSEAAAKLKELGAKHIDADGISREVTRKDGEALPAIRERFGDGVFDANGELDRRALSDIVFADPSAKRALEAIIHPLVQRRVMNEIEAADRDGIPVTVVDVPLLFETGMDVLCDETWTMTASEETQIERVCMRDGFSEEQVRARIAAQLSCAERDARATRVINTERPLEKTQAEIEKLYTSLIKRLD